MRNLVKRRTKIGSSWVKRRRKINGKMKWVKVRKVNGKEVVRMIGVRNTTDRAVSKKKRKARKKNYANTTDGAKRVSHRRKKRKR